MYMLNSSATDYTLVCCRNYEHDKIKTAYALRKKHVFLIFLLILKRMLQN